MNYKYSILILIVFAVAAAILTWIFSGIMSIDESKLPDSPDTTGFTPPVFSPPKPENAPEEIRASVVEGYEILKQSNKPGIEISGNGLNCSNCHFDAGRSRETIILAGVYAKYSSGKLRSVINSCISANLNGKPLAGDSKKMNAVLEYLRWISEGVPIGSHFDRSGLERKDFKTAGNAAAGKIVFGEVCFKCHGKDGRGTLIAPPVTGPGSYTSASQFADNNVLASFIDEYMPKDNPFVTSERAIDAAAYLNSKEHPDPDFLNLINNE